MALSKFIVVKALLLSIRRTVVSLQSCFRHKSGAIEELLAMLHIHPSLGLYTQRMAVRIYKAMLQRTLLATPGTTKSGTTIFPIICPGKVRHHLPFHSLLLDPLCPSCHLVKNYVRYFLSIPHGVLICFLPSISQIVFSSYLPLLLKIHKLLILQFFKTKYVNCYFCNILHINSNCYFCNILHKNT